MSDRPGTPIPNQVLPILPSNISDFLPENEILVMHGPLAPPRNNNEVRKCYKCKQVYMIVPTNSMKELCSYCISTE
jgi:hypothetical protein